MAGRFTCYERAFANILSSESGRRARRDVEKQQRTLDDLYLERRSEHYLFGGMTKSSERAMADG
jgi:hypothetical protein